ncbi:MAG: YkvA family protein [Gammaproteobacteria bacterium]|nr:YkvA family protein [Gammaproteobacteria bacterium]
MPLQISFELSDKDLEHFKSIAHKAHHAVCDAQLDQQAIAKAARKVFEAADSNAELPEFISTRLAKLEVLVNMVEDKEWQLPEEEMTHVCSAMAYFANPDDLIPDRIPAIGFLDDAIMVELMVENLLDEIDAYQEFCQFRTAEMERRTNQGLSTDVGKEDWLADKRAVLHHRMRTRHKQRMSAPSSRILKLW